MKTITLLVLLNLVTLKICSAVVYVKDVCPAVQHVPSFDMEKVLGRWYQLARYDNDFEEMEHCVILSFTREGDQYMFSVEGIMDNKPHVLKATIRPASNGTGIVYFHSSVFKRLEQTDDLSVEVIAADYDKYLIFYECLYDVEQKLRHDYFWVATKFKTYEGEVKSYIDSFLSSTPFIDTSKLIWRDLSKKSCEINPINS